MDFKEWWKENIYKGESKTWVEWCELAYEAGQQSKQAEIDELQGKISKVLYAISQSELHGDRAVWGIQDEIKEIPK